MLAEAVDRGTTVVVCQFAQSTVYTFPQGFADQNYFAISPAPCEDAPTSVLGSISSQLHLLLEGVTNITQGTDKRRCSGALASGAELLADWNDRKPFVAIRNDKSGLVVSLSAQFGSVCKETGFACWPTPSLSPNNQNEVRAPSSGAPQEG
jgi:hypothetical protein